jgi:tRNA U34 2-thiouridine synthase MnmA/TrmU
MKVLIALSGGPESLVTAWLLKKQGMTLRGFYLDIQGSSDIAEKMAAIERKLGFSIQVVHLKEEVSTLVSNARDEARKKSQFFDAKSFFHQSILFPKLFELKEQHQFAKIATGHRVSVQEDPVEGISRVMRYSDAKRDESHLLIGLNQSQLSSLIIPLGSIPESMMSKLTLELDPTGETGNFDMNWKAWEDTLPAKIDLNLNGFEVLNSMGVRLGSLRENSEVSLGSLYQDSSEPNRKYRVVEISPDHRRVLVTEDQERKVQEIQFEEGYWFAKNDLKFTMQECSLSRIGHEKSLPIKLMQYEGNRLRGRLETLLVGEEANIFKGETVLWIDGQEVLGGGRVLRTK